MSPEPCNGNNKLKIVRHEILIEETCDDVKKILAVLDNMFKPNGVCDRRHAISNTNAKEIDSLKATNKILFAIFLAVLGMAIKAAFF